MKPPPLAGAALADALSALVYELLDAHLDTSDLARLLPGESWRAHLDYLRALQRRGHELLALADRAADRLGGVRP